MPWTVDYEDAWDAFEDTVDFETRMATLIALIGLLDGPPRAGRLMAPSSDIYAVRLPPSPTLAVVEMVYLMRESVRNIIVRSLHLADL